MVKMPQKSCLVCKISFKKPINESLKKWIERHRFCSRQCANDFPRSKETRLKQSLAKIGKSSWNKGKKLTIEHKNALRKKHKSFTDTTKMCGRRPWNKIGNGVTPINERIRKSPNYKKWRKKIFERDNFTCVFCDQRGGYLHADHIKPFSQFPELRFEMTNGRTLCVPCHRKTDTYGWKLKYQNSN